MKRKHVTQKNHLIFKLKNYEQQFATWRSKAWEKNKFYIDAVLGAIPFYWQRIKQGVKNFNDNATELKNPMVREQNEIRKALLSIRRHIRMKHIVITQRNKRSKCMYAPSVSKDISFNQNLVSKFGTAE
jgi:hypothetical protein